MTLTTRLLVFFQSMLAMVLIGFSCAIYALADNYLHLQVGERVEAVLNSVSAIAEIGIDGVEWEPENRNQKVGSSIFGDQFVWLIADDQGQIVDKSLGRDLDQFLLNATPELRFDPIRSRNRKWSATAWEAGQIWIRSNGTKDKSAEIDRTQRSDDGTTYRALSVTAGVSLAPIKTTLRWLLGSLVGLSAGIWLSSFISGRFVCRRALRPMNRMAVAAGQIDAVDLAQQRLPLVTTNDELEGLSRAFNHLLDRLQEKFERQKRFTGDASHQLRTPLTAIQGQIEVALRRDRPADDYRRVLVTVQQRTAQLARMVESLLFLARANSEAGIPDLAKMDLTNWLPLHFQTWSAHQRFPDMVLDCPTSKPCALHAHSGLLGELLNVLLDNACKFSEPGSTILVQCKLDENSGFISVVDNGCGIEAGDLESIFIPFCRSEEARRRGIEGVGLGLSIAKRLAELFKGELTVTSSPTVGSEFSFRCPLVRESVAIPSAV